MQYIRDERVSFKLEERNSTGNPHICESMRAFSCSVWSNGKHGDCYFPEITDPIPIICTCAKVSIMSKNALPRLSNKRIQRIWSRHNEKKV